MLGLILGTALMVYATIKKKGWLSDQFKPFHYWILVTALITFLLFFRFRGFSLYQLVFQVPGFISIRAVHRIINVVMIFFAVTNPTSDA